MKPQNPVTNADVSNQYGYSDGRCWNLDQTKTAWSAKAGQGWKRLFELTVDMRQTVSQHPQINEADASRFNDVCRSAFAYIGKRHHMGPTELWRKVKRGLVTLKMTADELDDVERLIFNWQDLNVESFERYRFRYPERCPLLDVLCTLDETYKPLNDLQDWMLELKGTKGTRRVDLLPKLPDPDGIRTPSLV